MPSEVLYFKAENEDYEVFLLTNDDIGYSWNKFQARVTSAVANEYCSYASSDKGTWRLYDYANKTLSDVDVATLLHPVVYETNSYHVCIYFNQEISDPKALHVRKDVEEWFYEDPKAKKDGAPKLEGNTDFLNEPGVFKLAFQYTKEGRRQESFITFDVVSPKMDTKNDYKSLIATVNKEYENVVFRYLATTYQQFSRGGVTNDQVWLSTFHSYINSYLKGIKTILNRPHSKMASELIHTKAERIKFFTPELEEEYAEKESEKRLETHYFSYKQTLNEVDSKENRFVKHTLLSIGKRLVTALDNVQKSFRGNEEMSEKYKNDIEEYKTTLNKLPKHPFFKKVGKFEGMSSDSLVLQSRQGYMQVYKAWIMLKRGIDLYNGEANIGTLQIWEIYELWCFIKMKQLVKKVMGIDKPDYEHLETEPKGTMLNSFTNSKLEYVAEFHYPEGSEREGDFVSLHYQHTFNRRNQDDQSVHTATTEQRPDIVLNIRKAGTNEITLTYLYDVKYRVWNDKKLDIDLEEADLKEQEELNIKGADYPPSDAINQMHRYRDAIYYGSELSKHQNKEVIGGYILFPGRGDEETIANRYYQRSIETVNIGAIPLLPQQDASKEGALLEKHLRHILIDKANATEHVRNAVPQRGLYYTEDERKSVVVDRLRKCVLTGVVRKADAEYNDFMERKATEYIMEAIPKGKNMLDVEYLLPMVGGRIDGYYKVEKVSFTIRDNEGVKQPALKLELGSFTKIGEEFPNVYQSMKPGEFISIDDVMELYEKAIF